ncbi:MULTISPECIES: hypothetical protein [unclassified Isoptericola]|uniref:hypothetical protein n=1 Tax=unclassified Isoptericola TaxID=2623355 RepID=UPI00364619CA
MSDAQTSTSDLTAQGFYLSVTGEERGLVNRVFKRPLARMAKEDQETFVEALVFLDLHRRREPDPAGRASAMTVGQLQDYFADDEQDEDEEAVAAGEG